MERCSRRRTANDQISTPTDHVTYMYGTLVNVVTCGNEPRIGGRAVPRRGAPLQPHPAGRVAPVGRRGRAGADRRHHREPLLRGQLPAPVPFSAVPPRPVAGGGRPHRPPARPRRPRRQGRGRRSDHFGNRADGDARITSTPWRWPPPSPPGAARPACNWPTPRPPSTPGPSATSGMSDTTPSRRSSSPCGGPTPTPPCTGSPACWRRARTPATSPAGWWSWPRRTSAWPTRWPWS